MWLKKVPGILVAVAHREAELSHSMEAKFLGKASIERQGLDQTKLTVSKGVELDWIQQSRHPPLCHLEFRTVLGRRMWQSWRSRLLLRGFRR